MSLHGRISCSSREEGVTTRIVGKISLFVRDVWGEEGGHKPVAISHTVPKNAKNSRIMQTVEKIKTETRHRAKRKWQELYPGEEASGYFVAKVDVSELEMENIQKGLPAMQRLLESVGFGLYQIDYTQDFSRVLDRPALVQHLVEKETFFKQGSFTFPDKGGCILDNTSSVGRHVCTFVQTAMTTQPLQNSTTRLSRSSRLERCRRFLVVIWQTMCTAQTNTCVEHSRTRMCRKEVAHVWRSHCTPVPARSYPRRQQKR